MQVNTNQKIHCYTQGQQGIASILLIVCLLVSLSLESALADPKGEEATRSETTTSPLGQLASTFSRPVVEETDPLLGQLAEDHQDSSLRQNAQGSCATAYDRALQLLDQAAKEQDPTVRQASAYALGNLATADDKTLQLLDQAPNEQDEDVRDIALAALKAYNAASSTSHAGQKQVRQNFFKQAVATNDVLRLTELILENTDEVGELCESLAVDQLMKILPQTADTLLTWGVKHNKYKLVQLIIEHGRQHITSNLMECVGQRVTQIAAQKGYQELFLLLINNGVDVDTRKRTAFVGAIICGQYQLAQAMIRLGEDRLEQPNDNGKTPQGYLDKKQRSLRRRGEQELLKQAESLKLLLSQKIQAMQQNKPKEEQQASSKKEQ